jgi:RNA polymerase sigma-70 factor (ECF subfamily)
VAANLAINRLRRRKLEFGLDEAEDETEDRAFLPPEASLLLKEHSADIQAALARLPAPYRAAIELRHFQEMNYEQMAAALGVPLNTARIISTGPDECWPKSYTHDESSNPSPHRF